MNYYEHHIGDYAEATAHLSFVEDAAYSRLIRKYYAQEKAMPGDLKAVQRLVGARTKEEKEAVETVLAEFFELREDGYHNTRCDEEISRYQDKQAKAKASADARWNKQRAQSDGNANASMDAMRTHSEGNAHQTPDTRHQTPDKKQETNTPSETGQVGGAGSSEARATAVQISVAMRSAGVASQPADPRLIALAEQGMAIDTVKAACEEAKKSKPGERIGVGYVVAILARWGKEAAAIDVKGAQAPAQQQPAQPRDEWWRTDAGITRKGRELGMFARGTESFADFKDRIFEHLRKNPPTQGAAA